MIYEALKGPLLDLLKAPTDPPPPPIGSPDSVEVFRASPRFLWMRLLVHFGSVTPALVLELLLMFAERLAALDPSVTLASSIALALTLVVVLVRYFLIRLDYDMRYYVVTDRSLRIRQGALTIQESTFTFANVQNLSIHQGPLERLFGIANLYVETAGGTAGGGASDGQGASYHHGVLAGIHNAQALRDRILVLLRTYRDAGLGDHEDRGEPKFHANRPDAALDRLREIADAVRALKAALER